MIKKPIIMIPSLGVPTDVFNGMAKQRDADAKYYEPLIKDMYEALLIALPLIHDEWDGTSDDSAGNIAIAKIEQALAKVKDNNAK